MPYKAEVRFKLLWKDKEINEEHPIILPDIYFKKADTPSEEKVFYNSFINFVKLFFKS